MLRTTVILILLTFPAKDYGQYSASTSKNTSAPERLTDNISIYYFLSPFGDLSDEVNFLDVNGNIQGDQCVINNSFQEPMSFPSDLKIPFVNKLLLPYSIDLPPPISF